jgi:hypothetical protein
VPSPLCGCGRGLRTVKHILIICPRYAGARQQLRDEQGHLPDFLKLLGTAEGLRKISKLVMQRGILGQFRGARDALYVSLSASSLDPDGLWHRCEVLKTTENLKEKLLAGGGGFYSPKGFSSPQTCN